MTKTMKRSQADMRAEAPILIRRALSTLIILVAASACMRLRPGAMDAAAEATAVSTDSQPNQASSHYPSRGVLQAMFGSQLDLSLGNGKCNACHEHGDLGTLDIKNWLAKGGLFLRSMDDQLATEDERRQWLIDYANGDLDGAISLPAAAGAMRGALLGNSFISSLLGERLEEYKRVLTVENDSRFEMPPLADRENYPGLTETQQLQLIDLLQSYNDPAEAARIDAEIDGSIKGSPGIVANLSSAVAPCEDAASTMTASSLKKADRKLPMFGCDNSESLACFGQTSGDLPLFPEAAGNGQSGWLAKSSRLGVPPAGTRILRLATLPRSFPLSSPRISPDGKLILSSLGHEGKIQVFQLQSRLNASVPANVEMDGRGGPLGFFPDNETLALQKGEIYCRSPQLAAAGFTAEIMAANSCVGGMPQRQLSLALTPAGSRFLSGSDAGYSLVEEAESGPEERTATSVSDAHHPETSPGQGDAHLQVTLMTLGKKNQLKPGGRADINTPGLRHWILSKDGTLAIGQAFPGAAENTAFRIHALELSTKSAKGRESLTGIKLRQVGVLCLPPGKADLSFDNRWLVSHHLLTREDAAEYQGEDGFGGRNSTASDLFLADLKSGRKFRLTSMPAGHRALHPQFRADGWIVFFVRDAAGDRHVMATDAALRLSTAGT